MSVATNLISLRSKMKIAVKSDKILFPSNKLSLVKLQKSQSWREALLNESTSKSSGYENILLKRFHILTILKMAFLSDSFRVT